MAKSHVIEGTENSLRLIDAIQLEMSLIPLYKGEPLFDEMYKLLCRKGHCIVSIEPGFQLGNVGEYSYPWGCCVVRFSWI